MCSYCGQHDMSQWPGSDHRSSFSGRKKDSLGREWHTFSAELEKMHTMRETTTSEFMEKTFQAAQLTHERFLTIDHSCKIFFWYLPNWTSTDLWCVVLYVTYTLLFIIILSIIKDDFALNLKDRQRWKLWAAVRRLSNLRKVLVSVSRIANFNY